MARVLTTRGWTAEAVSVEDARLADWQLERMTNLGLHLEDAERLVAEGRSWHEVERLVARGCPPHVVVALLV